MAETAHTYNGRIWQSVLTTSGKGNFFHAVFGEGQPSFDRDSSFRRFCLLNFFIYMEEKNKPQNLRNTLETILDAKETEENYQSRYISYLLSLKSSQHVVSVREIPLVAALNKTRLVVFVGDNEVPDIFHPEEELLGSYPWKSKDELKEVVVHFNENHYTRLGSCGFEEPSLDSSLELSMAEEQEAEEVEDDAFHTQTYPKLTGSAGVRGILYQIDLLTVFLINGTSKLGSFRLSTENKTTGKFDDVVLETRTKKVILLQAKHKQNKKIYDSDLFNSGNNDFSLPMYYMSYQEFKRNIDAEVLYLCTNTSSALGASSAVSRHMLEDDDPLYVQGEDNSYLKFNDSVIPEFRKLVEEYKDKNVPNESFDEDVFADDCLRSFFSKFRLVTKYPARGSLSSIIEELLGQREHCTVLQTMNCAKYLNGKMLDWFDGKKGKYLNENTLRIFLSEFRSNNFCEKLCNFQIHMRERHRDYFRKKRLVHIEFRGSYVLNMVKVYYSLYVNKKRYIFVSPVEVADVQAEAVRAFEDSSHEVLVACFKIPDDRVEEIAKKLTDILKKFAYKRVVLITGENDGLAESLRRQNEAEYEEVFENITFNHLTQDSQRRLLKRVTHFFEPI